MKSVLRARQEEGVRVSVLASGSSGNAFLVEVGAQGTTGAKRKAGTIKLLIDAGLPAGTLEHYLRQRGVSPGELTAIFVSHEHIDHMRGAGVLARRYSLPVVASEGTFLAGAAQLGTLPDKIVLSPGSEMHMDGAVVRTFAVCHDAAETVGFWIQAGGRNIVICTDLGCETGSIREALEAADLLVLESNHDLQKLWRGPYPYVLKRRVAGDRGHLSNAEAARLVSELARDGRDRTVWLAHLSAANNTPALAHAHATVIEPLEREGCTHVEVAVLARDRPSHTWHASSK